MQNHFAITAFYLQAERNFKDGKSRKETQRELTLQNQNLSQPIASDDLDTIIESAYLGKDCPVFQEQVYTDGIIVMTYRDEDVMIFTKDNYEFRFTNINIGSKGKLRTTLTLSISGKYILKTELNPSIHSHRDKFVRAANDKELELILVELESLIRRQLAKEEKELLLKAKQSYIMTDTEKAEATQFLADNNNILYKIVDATNRMGVVGEEILRLMIYLCFTSRILKDPLSMTVKGESSSGKSFSCQNILKLIPEEGYHFITRATQNAFYHLPEDGMQHKIIYINEVQGSETADYSIRSAQSEGDLILMMPIKDPVTGNMETITKRVKGPVGFLVTTTKPNMFDENETRNFSVFSDDSPELTKNIGNVAIRKAKGEVFELDHKEINLWRNMQRLLKPDLKVIIPYAEEVLGSFPDNPVRVRRDRERFRVFLNVITILHQTHRKIDNGLIYSTIADYQIAKILAEELLLKTIFESNPTADILAQAIQQMDSDGRPFGLPTGQNNATDPNTGEGYTFTYQDIADRLGWDVKKVKKWMGPLTRCGMVEYVNAGGYGHGKKAIMRLNETKSQKVYYFLPEPAELLASYPCSDELFYNPLTGEKGIIQPKKNDEDDRPF